MLCEGKTLVYTLRSVKFALCVNSIIKIACTERNTDIYITW